MGKISNAIKMLNYLNTGNKYSVKDLAEKIGVTERMIRYYKAELEESGIPIETFMGPNGGYYIINIDKQYNHFNKYDIELLNRIYNILNDINYEDIDKYQDIISKIKFARDVEEEKSKYFLDAFIAEDADIYKCLCEAIKNKSKTKILYKSLSQGWQERVIHPLQFFDYNNKLYVTAYCELRSNIRHFEIDKIKLIKK